MSSYDERQSLDCLRQICFAVYGVPVAKARARVVKAKIGRTRSYTPNKTAEWEASILTQVLAHKPEQMWEGPIILYVDFYLLKPKSVKRLHPTVRPDLDNYLKSVQDALNGVIYRDDSQIIRCQISKQYGEMPHVDVTLWEVC